MLKLFYFYIFLMEQADTMEKLEEIRLDLIEELDNGKFTPQHYNELMVALDSAMELQIEDYLIVQEQMQSSIFNGGVYEV